MNAQLAALWQPQLAALERLARVLIFFRER
jgi:hypothetical protein